MINTFLINIQILFILTQAKMPPISRRIIIDVTMTTTTNEALSASSIGGETDDIDDSFNSKAPSCPRNLLL